MKKMISSAFIVCLAISNISFADNRNERVELMKEVYKEYDNIKKCIGEYVYEQAKNTESDPFQIAMEALSICDDSIEAARMFNRKYVKLAISSSEGEKGKMLYMTDKLLLEQKEEWINNIQKNINNIRNPDN